MIGSLQNKIRETFERYRSDAEYRELIRTSFFFPDCSDDLGTGFW